MKPVLLLLLIAVVAAAEQNTSFQPRSLRVKHHEGKRMLGDSHLVSNSNRLFGKSGKSKSVKSNHSRFADHMKKIENIESQLQAAKDDLKETLREGSRILITGGEIITMNPTMDVLSESAIYIENGFIQEIGDITVLQSTYEPDFVLELADHDIVLPGLINTHGHVCMTAFGDLVDDQELNTWLYDYIFPLEATLVTSEFCAPFFKLGMAEMLQSGTTSFLDFYFYQNDLAKLVKEAGMRAVMCEGVFDFPSPDFQTPNETFAFVESFLQNWKDDEFVTPCIAPHAPYTTSPWIYQRAAELVDEYGGLLTTHLSESPTENQTIQQSYGVSPTEYLYMNNFLTAKTILSHSIWLSDSDRKLIHDGGSHLSHNPSSDLKLASGFFDWMAANDAEINIAMGTDGPGSNNDLDMIEEMRLASLVQKGKTFSPTTVSAKEALYASTMGGAIAIGRQDELGSIEVGKRADIAIVKRDSMKLYPAYDPHSAIVYASNGNDVFATIVDGKVLYYDGEFITIDQAELIREVSLQGKQVEDMKTELWSS